VKGGYSRLFCWNKIMTSLRKLKKLQKRQAQKQTQPTLTEHQQELINLKKRFIELYPEYGTVGSTLKQIGIKSRNTFYEWMKDDAEFKAIYESQLQPDRRDVVASVIFRASIGKEKLNKDQLQAAMGFLRATEAGKKKKDDDLIFTEHTKSDIDLHPGGVNLRVTYDDIKRNGSTGTTAEATPPAGQVHQQPSQTQDHSGG
jgi:hypothetical protein